MNGQFFQAIDSAKQSLSIAIEMGIPATYEYGNLSQAYLLNGQLDDALINANEAQKFDEPKNNHNISTLLGIIALRQGDMNAAHQAFTLATAQADEILAKTPEYYEALDAKGLATCGLALTQNLTGLTESHSEVKGSDEDLSGLIAQAIETFRAARKIAPHAGIVKRNLRLFDELAKCDPKGLLEGVREAVEGK